MKPETALRWRRRGWRAYWSWRSNRQHRRTSRRPIPQNLRALIRQMATENRLWGQRRIQAELARLGFEVSARTVAKYTSPRGGPSPGWRKFCNGVNRIYGLGTSFAIEQSCSKPCTSFFVVLHVNRDILHVAATACANAFQSTSSECHFGALGKISANRVSRSPVHLRRGPFASSHFVVCHIFQPLASG